MRHSLFSKLALFFLIGTLSLALPSLGSAADVSPDGLELSGFMMVVKTNPPRVGEAVKISFALKNVTAGPIRFHPDFGVFVGARWNSTTDANNRDFGHQSKGKVLLPGVSHTFTSSRKLDAVGTWRFWPAYNVNGHWGPFRWNETTLNVIAGPVRPTSGGK